MTADEIIDRIIEVEGGFVNDPKDRGGSTKFGVTAGTLGLWRSYGRPATADEVRHLSVNEAREIYRRRYILDPRFDRIQDDRLRAQLVDDGVLSGPGTAIKALQSVIGVPADGVLGPQSLAAVNAADPASVRVALVKARVLRMARIVQRDVTQVRFLAGWLTRTMEFI